jgi:hypothetical protein
MAMAYLLKPISVVGIVESRANGGEYHKVQRGGPASADNQPDLLQFLVFAATPKPPFATTGR